MTPRIDQCLLHLTLQLDDGGAYVTYRAELAPNHHDWRIASGRVLVGIVRWDPTEVAYRAYTSRNFGTPADHVHTVYVGGPYDELIPAIVAINNHWAPEVRP